MNLLPPFSFNGALLRGIVVSTLVLSVPTLSTASSNKARDSKKTADMVFLNGYVYTAAEDSDGHKNKGHADIAQSVVTRNNKIIFVGSDKKAKKYIGKDTIVIDLNGKMVLPGFIDSHTHMELFSAARAQGVDLTEVYTPEDYISSIRAFAQNNPDVAIIRGFNYGLANFITGSGGASATAEYLDQAVADRPAAIFEVTSHSMWVNTKALELLGITDATPNPPNGVIERDANGHATGQLLESAVSLVTNSFPQTDPVKFQDEFLKTVAFFNSKGVTGAFEAMNSMYGNIDTQNYYHTAIQELAEQEKLTMRMRGSWYINPADAASPKSQIDTAVANTQAFKSANGLFRTETFKFFIDGILEGNDQGTALMLQPYCQSVMYSCAGTGTYKGIDFWANANKDLVQALKDANNANFQLHIHTIGDGAVRKASLALEQAHVNKAMHPTFAHVQFSEPEDIERMARLGVYASLTFNWMELDSYFSAYYYPRLGFDRANQQYDLQSLFDAGVNVTTGSDYAISDPEYNLHTFTGLTRLLPRKVYDLWYGDEEIYPYISDLGHIFEEGDFDLINFETVPIGPLAPASERAKAIEDLINAYTINSARQLRIDDQAGSIEVGKSADLVVWDTNWFNSAQQFAVTNKPGDLDPIVNSSVLYTIFEGKIVYDATTAIPQE